VSRQRRRHVPDLGLAGVAERCGGAQGSPLGRRDWPRVRCRSRLETTTTRLYVGLTDLRWFEFLSATAPIDEVNFWQPSGGRHFRALSAGEPFLFKLRSPRNYIVGGAAVAR
jgi:hypothetical protein